MSCFDSSPIEFLSDRFNAPHRIIKSYLHKAPRRYKQYSIPKRNGLGERQIAQPTRALKMMQRLTLERYLKDLPIHDCANAYVKNKNIKSNITPHLNSSYLLKMDFSNFFPSICPSDLIVHVIRHIGTPDAEELFVLENLFFFSNTNGAPKRLSIGAPSSPFISNTILFEFDTLVSEICANDGVSYTRYADDLSFSTNKKNVLYSYPEKISAICARIQYPRLALNSQKTVFSSKARNRHITGLVINNSAQISIGREKKRYIKSLVWKFKKGELTEEQVAYLRGIIAFCKGVEPSYYEGLVVKYGADVFTHLK
jgi:RNA-directed DNA polymerase